MMKTDTQWTVYRTRFVVRAKQLTQPISFVDPLGHEHHGLPGDYLVESPSGYCRIAPRSFFEDVYVPMEPAVTPPRHDRPSWWRERRSDVQVQARSALS